MIGQTKTSDGTTVEEKEVTDERSIVDAVTEALKMLLDPSTSDFALVVSNGSGFSGVVFGNSSVLSDMMNKTNKILENDRLLKETGGNA